MKIGQLKRFVSSCSEEGGRVVESGSSSRCSVEFRGVVGWSCEVKIRKLLWS
ncbi:hypothetical protein LINPERHAP1_LOCUS80 [Linum perenne]